MQNIVHCTGTTVNHTVKANSNEFGWSGRPTFNESKSNLKKAENYVGKSMFRMLIKEAPESTKRLFFASLKNSTKMPENASLCKIT